MKWLVVMIVLGCSRMSHAAMIQFTYSGAVGGSLNGVGFGISAFTITGTGDTATRVLAPTGAFQIPLTSATITIAGLGTSTFVTSTQAYVNQGASSAGFQRAGLVGNDLIHTGTDPTLHAWNMLTGIGPLSGPGRVLQWTPNFGSVATDHGPIILNDAVTSITFLAAEVPSPSVAAVCVAGGMFALRRYRRR
jgi:hypothetical protein